jgi:hypothetical protein
MMRGLRESVTVAALVLVDLAALALGARTGVLLSAVAGLVLLGLAPRHGRRAAVDAAAPGRADDDGPEASVAAGWSGPVADQTPAREPAREPVRQPSGQPSAALQAQQVVDETAGAVIRELCELIDQVDTVRRSAL